jgi:hypothetical protein
MTNTRSFIASLLLLITHLASAAQTPPSREYELKAVFLFNFSQFVEWPPASFSTGQAPFVIGILGKNPFGTYLEEIVSGERANGHTVTIQYYNDVKDIGACHILFINITGTKNTQRIVESLKGRNTLTVSDASDFSEQGGMVRFFTRDNKIKFEINPDASKAAGLVISSKLLRLAEIFTPQKNS